MNRFPIPGLNLLTSMPASAGSRYFAETARSSASSITKKATSGWGPASSDAGFANDAAAAEARERLLFFDALAGAAF